MGSDPASEVYVRNKHKFTRKSGMRSLKHKMPENIDGNTLVQLVENLNKDDSIDGILVQLHLPKELNTDRINGTIDPTKDVDGLTEISAGRLSLGRTGLRPCIPEGCVILARKALSEQGEDLSEKHCVIVGRSILVGIQLRFCFSNKAMPLQR